MQPHLKSTIAGCSSDSTIHSVQVKCTRGSETLTMTTDIIRTNGIQTIQLPEGFQFDGDIVSIRREGNSVILEPVKPTTWPPGFFEAIRIDDPAFERPPQGAAPKLPALD
jgi:hypothetical protein